MSKAERNLHVLRVVYILQGPGAKLRGATAYRPRHNVLVAGPE